MSDANEIDLGDEPLHPDLLKVLESAARLQELVPDAVLVGGTAAAYYARHRLSFDHDHVLQTLRDRFDLILDALGRDGDFVLNRATPGKIILGELGGIEVGVRQLIRRRPLEVQRIELPSGHQVLAPTEAEISRIKAYLIVKRNQVRDYIDIAALTARFGEGRLVEWLLDIDDYYADDTAKRESRVVLTQLLKQLARPEPRDRGTLGRLGDYKGLARRWADWAEVERECQGLANALVERE